MRKRQAACLAGTKEVARYFVAGNVWLMLALLMVWGRSVERTQSIMDSFFGVGDGLEPTPYSFLVVLAVAVGWST
jgi:hypothetical protein